MSETEERPVSDNTAENAGGRDRQRKKKRQLHKERRRTKRESLDKGKRERRRKKERVEETKGERTRRTNSLVRERFSLTHIRGE